MKKLILIILVATWTSVSYSQMVLFYNFKNSLNEVNGNGPALKVLGNEGIYVTDTLSEIGGTDKIVYRFESNNGVQFDNREAGNFIGNSYTIELYFVFDDLTSWRRVVDWKNRKSDNGAYVYNGQLNFYPVIYSGTAPVIEDEYTYYVVTRDGANNNVKVYTDAEVMIEFTDSYDYAIMDADSVLNFFYDDLSVPNEASSGAVAMLKLYNYVLDSATIKQNWDDIGGTVFGIKENDASQVLVRIYPNPATSFITVDLTNFVKHENLDILVLNDIGEKLYQTRVPRGNNSCTIPTEKLGKGLFLLKVNSSSGQANTKFIVN
jgi:hypothetical protein